MTSGPLREYARSGKEKHKEVFTSGTYGKFSQEIWVGAIRNRSEEQGNVTKRPSHGGEKHNGPPSKKRGTYPFDACIPRRIRLRRSAGSALHVVATRKNSAHQISRRMETSNGHRNTTTLAARATSSICLHGAETRSTRTDVHTLSSKTQTPHTREKTHSSVGRASRTSCANRSWLHVERCPAYDPDDNPAEYVWSSAKGKDMTHYLPKNMRALERRVRRSFSRINTATTILKGCLKASGLY